MDSFSNCIINSLYSVNITIFPICQSGILFVQLDTHTSSKVGKCFLSIVDFVAYPSKDCSIYTAYDFRYINTYEINS